MKLVSSTHCRLTSRFLQITAANICINRISPESLPVFSAVLYESTRKSYGHTGAKNNKMAIQVNQGHVFGALERRGRTTSLRDNVGLICKRSKDTANDRNENSENRSFRLPDCRLASPLHGIPENIRTKLISPETSLIKIHFAADSKGLSLFNFSW